MLPNSANPNMNISRFETANVRSRNKCKSMIGSLCCHSHQITNRIEQADTIANPRMKCDSNQSSRWPLSSTICSVPSPSATKLSPI